MTITLQPHQEQAIQAAVNSGKFRSVEEFIDAALAHMPEAALPASHTAAQSAQQEKPCEALTPAERRTREGRKSLVELFAESPLKGLDLDFSRNRSSGRPIDL